MKLNEIVGYLPYKLKALEIRKGVFPIREIEKDTGWVISENKKNSK